MKFSTLVLAAALLIGLSAMVNRAHAQTPTYSATLIDPLPGSANHPWPTAINNLGQVVGYGSSADGNTHAFLWLPAPAYNLPAGANDLGTLGGYASSAASINDYGQIVGYSQVAGGANHAFLWTPGGAKGPASNPQMQDLGLLKGYVQSQAASINNLGQVVGFLQPSSGKQSNQGFLWLPTPAYNLPAGMNALGKTVTNASALNDAGEIVTNAGLWKNGAVYALPLAGSAINNDGQIVGNASINSVLTQSLWTPTAPNGLPADGGTLTGINNTGALYSVNLGPTGIVVGDRNNTMSGHQEGWIWLPTTANAPTGNFYLLANLLGANPFGFSAVIGYAVNSSGQIPGIAAQTVPGPINAILLTPQ